MNVFAMVAADEALRVANARIAELQREASNQRLVARRPRRSLRAAVRSAFTSFRDAIASVDHGPITTPRLADYPYRS
jgi:ethanolamine utilization microcompartment shell protein EutL